jgi:hypothetical protein
VVSGSQRCNSIIDAIKDARENSAGSPQKLRILTIQQPYERPTVQLLTGAYMSSIRKSCSQSVYIRGPEPAHRIFTYTFS